MSANAHRPKLADGLEVKGRMSGIRLEQLVFLIGELADVGR